MGLLLGLVDIKKGVKVSTQHPCPLGSPARLTCYQTFLSVIIGLVPADAVGTLLKFRVNTLLSFEDFTVYCWGGNALL